MNRPSAHLASLLLFLTHVGCGSSSAPNTATTSPAGGSGGAGQGGNASGGGAGVGGALATGGAGGSGAKAGSGAGGGVGGTSAQAGSGGGAGTNANAGSGGGGGTTANAGNGGGGGQPPGFLASVGAIVAIAVDADAVYLVDQGTAAKDFADGALVKVPLAGGAPITLAAGQSYPRQLVLRGDQVYWTNQGVFTQNPLSGSVARVAKAGGAITTIASAAFGPAGIAANAAGVYWAEVDAIHLAPADGSAPVTIGKTSGGTTRALAVDGANLYYVEGSVWKMPVTGGASAMVSSGPEPWALALGADTLYVTFSAGNIPPINSEVQAIPLAGGPATSLVKSSENIFPIAVDASGVYYASFQSGCRIYVVKGVVSSLLYQASGACNVLALDDSWIYTVLTDTQSGGSLVRIPKP